MSVSENENWDSEASEPDEPGNVCLERRHAHSGRETG